MTYPQVKRYLDSLANYEKDINYSYQKTLTLKRIRDFLALIGNPQQGLRIIHIAGTKGKGSTCALVAYILREANFSVGLYTSPHLNDFRERIRILRPLAGKSKPRGRDFEGKISRGALTGLVNALAPVITKYNRRAKYGRLSFFEVYTALAFLYFKRQGVNFVVLETGLGGRLDATNVADSLICGITPLSFEHVQKLGNTLVKIAAEKAAIIKRQGGIVISASQAPEARRMILARCEKFQARLYEVGRQIKYSKIKNSFTIKGLNRDYKNLRLNLRGEHQIANAALAVGLVESLSWRGFNVPLLAIRRGLKHVVWPGRCEVIHKRPLIVLDGAQNLASARVLKKAIRENFSAFGARLADRQESVMARRYRKLILVLGISSDKDIAGICKCLGSLADEVILTRADTVRAAPVEKLAGYFKRKLHLTSSVKEAKLLAGQIAQKEDLILVTGSLFVVGEFRNVKR